MFLGTARATHCGGGGGGQHTIDKGEARRMADELKAEYWEVSAKKGIFLAHDLMRGRLERVYLLTCCPKDHNVNELFDRVAAALFEQSVLKTEAKKNATTTISLPSRTDSAISDRYVGTPPPRTTLFDRPAHPD